VSRAVCLSRVQAWSGGWQSIATRAAAVAIVVFVGAGATASVASAEEAIYSATRSVAVPPASNFKTGGGGGDGWAVALSNTAVYNVYHHDSVLTVACHAQKNGEECFSPETIRDGEGHNFATSGHPGLYLDEVTGKLYVYATRTSDQTAGVVCIDTNKATEEPNPFCGFTALTPVGEGQMETGISETSTPMLIGTHWYAFNMAGGKNVSGVENEMLCFDVGTDAACAGQPFSVPIGEGEVNYWYPGPPAAVVGSKAIVLLHVSGKARLVCFDDATSAPCAGAWPLTAEGLPPFEGEEEEDIWIGSPFPLLDKAGSVIGFCLPTGADECYDGEAKPVETPSGMTAAITANDEWNGPGVTIGPRVYVPNGQVGSGVVQCYDFASHSTCANFPRSFENLGYLYTVNRDPQRPTCLWVNADNGTSQIQDFDAYTGEACGTGPVRGLGSQFVAPGEQCTPISYISLKVLQPERSAYTSGAITFTDGDGEPLPGLEEVALDTSGSLNLENMNLNSPTGLPQFLFRFNGLGEEVSSIEVQLTWRATYAESCAGEGRNVSRLGEPAPPKPEPPVVTTPAPAPPAPTPVVCTTEQVALTNVVERGSHVWIEGAARVRLVGSTVSIKLTATGQTVATATVASNGTFTATAPLPPQRWRHSNRVRYEASIGSLRSLPLKLYRRMYITSMKRTNAGVLLAGKVTGSFKPGAPVALFLQQTCSGEHLVGRSKLTRAGTFSVLVPAPSGLAGQLNLYRGWTEVLYHKHAEPTWTLPTIAVS
jgi:hypothetical protein